MINIKEINDVSITRLISRIKDLIPTNLGDLNNDCGFITKDEMGTIPTKTSDLVNDSNFVTKGDIANIPTRQGNMTYVSTQAISSNEISLSALNSYSGYTPATNDLVIDPNGNIGVITSISGTTATVNTLIQLAPANNPTLYGKVTIDDTLTGKTLEATEKMNIPGGSISVE